MNADDIPRIECVVTFHDDLDDWPHNWPKKLSGCVYRPCVVVGDPNQRKAILISKLIEVESEDGTPIKIKTDKFIDEKYMGVMFEEGPEFPELGQPLRVKIIPIGWPDELYKELVNGATFTIREGAKIVGFGTVIRWHNLVENH